MSIASFADQIHKMIRHAYRAGVGRRSVSLRGRMLTERGNGDLSREVCHDQKSSQTLCQNLRSLCRRAWCTSFTSAFMNRTGFVGSNFRP